MTDRDELLALFADPARVWTAPEVAQVLGWTGQRAYALLNQLAVQGVLVSRTTTLEGRLRKPARVYQRRGSA